MRTSAIALFVASAMGCHSGHVTEHQHIPEPPLPLQIKGARDLLVRGDPAAFTLGPSSLAIDDREIPIRAYEGAPLDVVARSIARVPRELRDLMTELVVSEIPNPTDAAWTEKYRAPVVAGMGAVGSGRVTIYPHGFEQLRAPDGEDVFTRNLMHELGHCWSLRDWAKEPAGQQAWLRAIASDGKAPSTYAVVAMGSAGWPYEDVAETTALYFLIRGTPAFEAQRRRMPARFAILDARFSSREPAPMTR